jgi:PPOX class probable F420-dependent enzyme
MTDIARALGFAHGIRQGVLTTIRRDGRPQLSNVGFSAAADGSPLISVTADRAKTRNLRRDPRGALHVTDSSFRQYVVLDGEVSISPVATDPHDETVEALVAYYRDLSGEHDDWDAFRAAMVQEARCIATLTVTSAYGHMP